VILGGGLGGVHTAMELEKLLKRETDVEITLINRENYLVFQPMLSEVISGSIGILDTIISIRRLCPGVNLFTREVEAIDLDSKVITTSPGFWPQPRKLEYDYLVLALGMVMNFAGMPGLEEHTLPFKLPASLNPLCGFGNTQGWTPFQCADYTPVTYTSAKGERNPKRIGQGLCMAALFAFGASVAQAQTTCPVDPGTGNAVARLISPTDGSLVPEDPSVTALPAIDPVSGLAGAVTFKWCNASADYFLTVESVHGAHDIYFAFAGGPGAGVQSITLGPACNIPSPTSPTTGCIPTRGETIFVTLFTLKKGQSLLPSPFFHTFTAANAGTLTVTDFVTRLYQQVLNRAPEPGGVAGWVQKIQQDGSVVPTVLAFFHSQEFLGRNTSNQQFLTILYHTFLNRDPDQAGFNAFLSDLQSGLRTRDNLFDIFLDSAEFAGLASFLPPLDPVTAFVTNLYVRILGRGPDLPGQQGFVAQLQQSRTVLPTVLNFLHSPEFLNRNTSNTEYVTVLYRVLLNRVPDAPGLAVWVALLNNGTATRSRPSSPPRPSSRRSSTSCSRRSQESGEPQVPITPP
jgi:hypothetical protein